LINLDKAVRGFKDNDRITNKAIVFFNRAYCKIKPDDNFVNKTPGTPENKQLITCNLNEASKEPYLANIIAIGPMDTTIND
jgi:hypothetical protein